MNDFEYILGFIDSNTVYKHLIEIGYKPTALEAMFIVWQSKSYTLENKFEAFRWIKENMADTEIPAHEYHAARASVHAFLDEYMGILTDYMKLFQTDEVSAVYDFSTYYSAPDNGWVDDENLYSSYERVIDAAIHSVPSYETDFPTEARPILFRIRRRELDFEAGSDYLYLTPNMEPYRLSVETVMPDEDYETLHLFEELCPFIPHPFKVGDVISECAGKYALPTYYNDTLTVTDFYSEEYVRTHQDSLCMNDFVIRGICKDENGNPYEDSIDHYLRAEKIG